MQLTTAVKQKWVVCNDISAIWWMFPVCYHKPVDWVGAAKLIHSEMMLVMIYPSWFALDTRNPRLLVFDQSFA